MTGLLQTQKIFFAMGTVNTVTVFEPAKKALSAAGTFVSELNRRLSAFAADSEISAVSRNAGLAPVRVSADNFRLIERAVGYAEITDGCFDITSRPLSQLWKHAVRSGVLPDDNALRHARSLVNCQDIILDSTRQTVMLKQKGQQLDLGGIAKGFAADEIRNILLSYGVRDAVINLGGTVLNMGAPRTVGLQTPFAPNGQYFASLELKDGTAAVSSGVYEQCRAVSGRRIHHIADPRSGCPSDSGLLAVTLIGQKAEELDALATAALILGAEKSTELLKQRGIEAVFITDDRKVFVTDHLKKRLRMKGA